MSLRQGTTENMGAPGMSAGKYCFPRPERKPTEARRAWAQRARLPWLLDGSQETERRQMPSEKDCVTQLSLEHGPGPPGHPVQGRRPAGVAESRDRMLDRVSPSRPRSGLLGAPQAGWAERGGPSRWEVPLDPSCEEWKQ